MSNPVFESRVVTNKKMRPMAGVGASYQIPDSQVTTSLEFSHIKGFGDIKKDLNAIPAANMVTLNVAYNFELSYYFLSKKPAIADFFFTSILK